MKKRIVAFVLVIMFSLMVFGCGNVKKIDNLTYDTYGLFNESEMKNPEIEYRLILGNVIWGIILCETIIAPVYFLGFSLYEPVGKLDDKKIKGLI